MRRKKVEERLSEGRVLTNPSGGKFNYKRKPFICEGQTVQDFIPIQSTTDT